MSSKMRLSAARESFEKGRKNIAFQFQAHINQLVWRLKISAIDDKRD